MVVVVEALAQMDSRPDQAPVYALFIPRMAVAPWWVRLLRLRFQHCFLAWPDAGATLVLHHEGLHLRIARLDEAPTAYLQRLMRDKDAVIYRCAASTAPGRPLLRPPMTCVEVCKAMLGIAAPLILTPGQLARHLGRLGAARLVPL